jgi:hypothetical protein
MSFWTRGSGTTSERLRITSSGNVGIGVTSFSARLHVERNEATNSTTAIIRQIGDGGNGGQDIGLLVDIQGANDLDNIANFRYYNGSTYTSRMVIKRGGNVLIGTTTNLIAGNRKLQIEGTCAISAKSTGAGGETVLEAWQSHTSGDNVFCTFYTETTYTYRGGIDYNRGSNVVRYNTTSDANLKNIIGDSDKQKSIDILNSTRIREYSWKNDDTNKPQIGVIAQELYETYKGAVSKGSDVELLGTEDYKEWGVDKTAFTFHLIAGWQMHEQMIKEQQDLIQELSAKVSALENKS